MITKVIIPVAGLGTRFLPATKAQPKEMLPVIDKPVIQYLVEEAVASGIKDVIFVTGRGKRAIEDHFDYSPELETKLLDGKKTDAFREVRAISEMANFSYVRQKTAKGDGDAVLCAANLVGNEPVAVFFGDNIVDCKVPCLKQMLAVFEKYGDPVIALERVPWDQVNLYGIVDAEDLGGGVYKIKDIVEKPSRKEAPSNLAIVAQYIITPDVFEELRKIKPSAKKEVGFSSALKSILKKRPVYGLKFEGKRYDCGSKMGFLEATVNFALKHPELKNEFKKYLKGLKL